MASMLVGSFPVASSVTAVGSCWRSKKGAKSYYEGFYVTKASWYKTEKIQNEYPIARHQQHNLKHHHYCECARSFVVNAASGESFESEPEAPSLKSFWDSIKYSLDVFSRFSRTYTLIASAIRIISASLHAVDKLSDISPTFFIGLLKALTAGLFMCLYVSGLNQLSDVEIDKINKPDYPLASGEYSFGIGVIIVASLLILSFGLGWVVGSPPLLSTLSTFFILGTAYSIDLPWLRWKRSPVLAAMCIAVHQMVVQISYFLHMQTYVFKRPTMFPKSLIFAIACAGCSGLVLALFKDIPDMEGDEKYGIQTFALHFGQKRVFWICVSLLEMTYGVAILMGATSSCLWRKLITVFGHAILASVLWYHAKSVDLQSKAATQSFFLFIWKLFNVQFFILPLMR